MMNKLQVAKGHDKVVEMVNHAINHATVQCRMVQYFHDLAVTFWLKLLDH